MSNNLMQIYSAGEFSDDYMQIQSSFFHWARNEQKQRYPYIVCDWTKMKEAELHIKFYIIEKT